MPLAKESKENRMLSLRRMVRDFDEMDGSIGCFFFGIGGRGLESGGGAGRDGALSSSSLEDRRLSISISLSSVTFWYSCFGGSGSHLSLSIMASMSLTMPRKA